MRPEAKSRFLPKRTSLALVLLALATAPAHSQSPLAATQAAGPVGPASATLNGMAVARGYSTAAWFEWGTDVNYGSATTVTNIGTNGQVVRVSVPIAGLAPGVAYHYRLLASNAVGMAFGADNLLTTGMKVATWTDGSVLFPAIPPGLTNIVAQACGHGHSLAIASDGTVVAWGVPVFYSNYGQFNVPEGLSNVIAVAGGWVHSLALRQDGTVSAWGEYMSPFQAAFVPAGLTNVVAIAGGDSHSLALKSDGTVVAWGGNGAGQASVPAKLTNVVAISAGSTHSLALRADGIVVTWGSSIGTITPPKWLSNVVAIASETWHNLALRADGTVVAWGDNGFGQTNVPAGLSNVVAIAAGFRHSLALKKDGTLVAWGDARYVTNIPAGFTNGVAISSGDDHSLAIVPMNFPPRAFPRTDIGALNKDIIISLAGTDPNGDFLSFRITSPPTNGALYQFTGSARGDPIIAPDTAVSDPFRVVFSPSPDSFGAPYTTFGYVASDGQYLSPPALVTVMILPSPSIQTATFMQSGNRGFALGFDGFSNAPYAIQASSDLMNWVRLGFATQPLPGQFYFLDTGATNQPKRFYRITSP